MHKCNGCLFVPARGSRADAAPAPAPAVQLRDGRVRDVAAGQHPRPHHAVHEPGRIRGVPGGRVLRGSGQVRNSCFLFKNSGP